MPEIYVNGFSMSLPGGRAAGDRAGAARARDAPRCCGPGYAVEYDFVQPTELRRDARGEDGARACSWPGRSTARPATRRRPAQGLMAGVERRAVGARGVRLSPSAGRGLHRGSGRRPNDAGVPRAVPHVHVARGASAAAARRQRGSAADATWARRSVWWTTSGGGVSSTGVTGSPQSRASLGASKRRNSCHDD